MRLQMSCGIHTEAPKEAGVWCSTQALGRGVSRTGIAQENQDCRRAPDGRPCSHLISISPKYAVSNVGRYIKGKSAIQIARGFGGRQNNFTGEHFWAGGYFVSTVELDENVVRTYNRNQEAEDDRYDKKRLEL